MNLVTRRQASTAMKVARHEQEVAEKRQLALLIDADNTTAGRRSTLYHGGGWVLWHGKREAYLR